MLAVVDCRIPWDAAAELARRGYTVLHMPPHPALPSPVASHPDMLLFFAPDAIYCTNSYQAIAQRELSVLSAHTQKPIRTVTGEVGERYPTDILLNAAPVGDRLFCLPAHTARELTAQAGYRVVPVRQGYAKCSAVPIMHNALITADPSIATAAAQAGCSVLRLSAHATALKGYGTGFLGGAASFAPYLPMRELLFCGDLDTHPDAAQIRDFCRAHGVTCVSLSNAPLYDVGTIFLL